MNDQPDKNFGLNIEDFSKMRDQLIAGDDALFERIFLQQFEACRNYLVRTDKASLEDAYDASMEALLALRGGIVRQTIQYGNLRYLFTRMARQYYFKASKRSFDDLPAAELPEAEITAPLFEKEVYLALATHWKQLGTKCRQLLLRIFYREESMVQIGQELGIDSSTVRKRKQRCVHQLRELFGS